MQIVLRYFLFTFFVVVENLVTLEITSFSILSFETIAKAPSKKQN